ncbi:MAG: vgr related protein [Sphingorhabdus sp.]|jgi:hypothetical protein|uniref:vgr related protein n=1 Tax=Sphingorhabdus sp. TaxID=1902408 RepID=UPI0025EDDC04|nr:vgr related protein [Sphingorhabdus sp.]MCO4092712.1 vgr related protein [Sphingorhabdus sp.]
MFGPHKSGRPLTVRERALAQSVFGSALDYAGIRIHNRKYFWFQPRRVTMAPNGHLWFHPKGDMFCDDFCDASLSAQGLFIHELVHVWQHQKGIFLPLRRHPFCRYDYSLKPGWQLDQYGLEQQAEIVRHIFLLRNGAKVAGAPPLSQYEGVLPF